MIPRKIYLRKEELANQFMCERMVACNDSDVEYTDLSQVWHDSREKPREECQIVCIDECNKLYVGNIHLGNEPNDYWYGKPTVWNDNHLQIHWRFVQKWAYVNDLLPKKIEEI